MLFIMCIFSYHLDNSLNWNCGILRAFCILCVDSFMLNLFPSSASFFKHLDACLSLGLPGGLARSTHSSSSSDIKREEKEDDDNLSDKTDDEKKDHKAARNRAR